MVSPPRHVLRGWPTCYDGGTDTSAGRTPLGWRYTCLLGGRTTTAVLIHTSAGRTPLGWRYTYYGKPYVLFVFHQQEILCKSMGILRGGTTVGEKWCPPTWRWATSRLCPPPTKHVLRGWYIVYGGTDTYAGRIPLGWRYTCLLGGHVTTTAVLIHPTAGRTQAYLWGDIMLGRRYAQLNDTHLLYLGWLVLLLTWAIHTLVGATFEGDTHLLTITWAIHNLVGAIHFIHWSFWAIHILFTDLKACLQISVHAFEKVYVTQGPLSSLQSRLSHVRTLQQVNKQIIKHLHFIQRDCSLNNDNNAHGTIFYYKSACKFKGWFPPVFW